MLQSTVNQNNVYVRQIDQQASFSNWHVSRAILNQDWTQVRLSLMIYMVEHFVLRDSDYIFKLEHAEK